MTRGIIEGKRARDYERTLKKNEKNKLFNKFILDNILAKQVKINQSLSKAKIENRNNKNKFSNLPEEFKSLKVCDLACGPGNNIVLLKDKVHEIYGIDLSKEMIEICREKFSNEKSVKLKQVSAIKTKLESNYFDYVMIRMGLHHIKEKDKLLKEAYRILKKGGKFLVIDKYYINKFEICKRAIVKMIFQKNFFIFNEHLISKKETKNLFSSSKFKLVKEKLIPYSKNHTGQVYMYVLLK